MYRPPKEDWLANLLEWVAGKVLAAGIIVTVICTAGLLFYALHFSGTSVQFGDQQFLDGQNFIRSLQTGLLVGLVAFAVGMSLMFWGDIALGATLLLVALAFIFAPSILAFFGLEPGGSEASRSLTSDATGFLGVGGLVLIVAAVLVQVADVWVRVKQRATEGAPDAELTHGKGEKVKRQPGVPLKGKVWRLPLGAALVCPWCPRDPEALAANFMPGTRFTQSDLNEYCRHCVIYNEHQKKKYRMLLPLVVLLVGGFYALFREPLLWWTHGLVYDFDKAMNRFTFTTELATSPASGDLAAQPGLMDEIVLLLIILFAFTQVLKLIEFGMFKLKL